MPEEYMPDPPPIKLEQVFPGQWVATKESWNSYQKHMNNPAYFFLKSRIFSKPSEKPNGSSPLQD